MNTIETLKVTEGTKTNYKNKLKKVVQLGIDWKEDPEKIITILKTIDEKPNNTLAYLNIIIVLRKATKLDVESLLDYRADYTFELDNELSYTNKMNNINGLPSLQELIDFTASLYNEGKYADYIVNYLLIATNCRNKDLNCFITSSAVNDTDNFLVVKDNQVEFIRNNYKTVNTHGKLTSIITAESFVYACKSLMDTWLLGGNYTNVSSYVLKKTYQHIGQGRYFKIIVANSGKSDLIKLGRSRGTNVGVLLSHYDIERNF